VKNLDKKLFKSNNSDIDKYYKVHKMPHSHGDGHGHSHGHNHGGKADFWTKWNQVGEYVDALGTAYFFQGTVDNIKDLIEYMMGTYDPDNESNVYKISLSAASFASAMILAYGAAYCHGILNQQYQDPEPVPELSDVEPHEAPQSRAYRPLNSDEEKEDKAEVPPQALEAEVATDNLGEEEIEPSNPRVLSQKQKLLLAADGICHGAGKAGTFMGLAHSFLFFASPGVSNLPAVRVGLQAAGTFFGVGAAVAEVRTCKKSLLNHNQAQACAEAESRVMNRV
jgi:hypothetical protein